MAWWGHAYIPILENRKRTQPSRSCSYIKKLSKELLNIRNLEMNSTINHLPRLQRGQLMQPFKKIRGSNKLQVKQASCHVEQCSNQDTCPRNWLLWTIWIPSPFANFRNQIVKHWKLIKHIGLLNEHYINLLSVFTIHLQIFIAVRTTVISWN